MLNLNINELQGIIIFLNRASLVGSEAENLAFLKQRVKEQIDLINKEKVDNNKNEIDKQIKRKEK